MSERNKLTHMRLQKEEASLNREPIPNALVTRDGHLNFHFLLHDLDGPYQGGLYHGLFQLHENYPFNAPKLYFYTPSGRFQTNLPICTSFTNYHQETWTSAWNVRSLVLATISFMYSEEPSYGCRSDSEATRRQFAQESKKFNFEKIDNFDRLFGDKLVAINKITAEERDQLLGKGKAKSEHGSEQGQRNDSESERMAVRDQEEQMIINAQGEERQEIEHIQDKEPIEQHLLKQNPKQNNRRNDLKWTVLKGGLVVGILGGAYLVYRYLLA